MGAEQPPSHRIGRRTVLAAAGAALSGLGGCAGRSGGTGDAERQGTIAYLNCGVPVITEKGFAIGAASAGGGAATVVSTSPTDTAKGIAALNDLTRRNFGLIAVGSVSPQQLGEQLSAAVAQGVSLMTVDVPAIEGTGIPLHVGSDNVQLGALLAGLVADRLPADASGQVVLGNPRPGVPPLDSRIRGMRETFQKRLPKVEVLGPYDSGAVSKGDTGKSWPKLVAANPDALAFLGVGYSDGPSLVHLRRERKATWLAGGCDLVPAALEGVRSGDLLLISPEHALIGAMAGRVAAEYARNAKPLPEGWLPVPGMAVTPENVGEVTARQDPAKLKTWLEQRLAEIFADGIPPTRPLSEIP